MFIRIADKKFLLLKTNNKARYLNDLYLETV